MMGLWLVAAMAKSDENSLLCWYLFQTPQFVLQELLGEHHKALAN